MLVVSVSVIAATQEGQQHQQECMYPARSAWPSPKVTRAPSRFSATFCTPWLSALPAALAARPSWEGEEWRKKLSEVEKPGRICSRRSRCWAPPSRPRRTWRWDSWCGRGETIRGAWAEHTWPWSPAPTRPSIDPNWSRAFPTRGRHRRPPALSLSRSNTNQTKAGMSINVKWNYNFCHCFDS